MMKIKYLILISVILLAAKINFFEKNMAYWPDIDLFLAAFADDATFNDRSGMKSREYLKGSIDWRH